MSARVNVRIVNDLNLTWLERLKKAVSKPKNVVKVGYVSGGGVYEGGTTVATVAMAHEYGTESIPARPTLRPGVLKNTDKYNALQAKNIKAVLRGELGTEQALGQLGLMAAQDVQNEIRTGSHAPLKEATIKRKGSNKPLIDTAQMVQSVTFEVGND